MSKPYLDQRVELAPSILKDMKQAEAPVGVAEPGATDAAALLSVATQTPFDVERYKKAYMEKGVSDQWLGLEDMWHMAYPGAARARIEKMIEGKSLRLGINFKPVTPEEITSAVSNFAQTKDDTMMATVAERMAAEPMHPNADRNESQIRQIVSNSMDKFLVAEKDATLGMKEAVSQAYLATDLSTAKVVSGMIAEAFLPMNVYKSGELRNKLLNEDGILKNFSMANNIQVIKDHYAKATPEEKNIMAENLREWAKKNSSGVISSWTTAGLLGQLDNGKLFEYGNPDDKFNYALSVAGDVGDYLSVLGIFKTISKIGGASRQTLPRTVRLANAVNRRRSGSIMRGLLEGAQNNDTLKRWGLSTEEVIATQLPKPSLGSVVNMPGEVARDAARIQSIREEVSALDAATRAPIFSPEEVLGASERVAKEVEQAWAPRLRVNLSTMAFTSDRAGVEFGLTLGRDNMHGFASLRNAVNYARKIDDTGTMVQIMRALPNQTLEVAYTGKIIHQAEPAAEFGEFYVQLKHKYQLHPMDKMLFNDDAVLAPTWLGKAMKWLLPPTSVLKPEVANKYIANFLSEGAIQDSLGSIIRPMFKELDGAQRARVGEMWAWTEEFGRTNNRIPTWDELRQNHMDASDKELLGWWRLKQFYDTAYYLNNTRMQREWAARGFKTVYKGDIRYHGKPLSVPEARSFNQDGFITVYDPDKNKPVAIRNRDLEKLYAKGHSIHQLETPIATGQRNYHTLILAKESAGWNIKDLDQSVLKYIPGYYPRIYEDFYYVKRVTKGARVNGKMEDYEDTVAVASTEKEAQEFIRRITAATGDATVSYKQTSDVRLRTRDSTAVDLERMRIEGRLFFDERNARQLYNVNGGAAEIVDPINAINRTARMVSRQMATEDLVRSQKQAWKNTYGVDIKGLNIDTDTSVVVGDKLDELIKTAPKADRAKLVKARALWDHIRLIEGSSGEGATWFRGAAIQSAEFIHNLRGIGGNQVTAGLIRNAHKAAPVEWMKNLAFFDFLVTRPARQLLLQGSQHLFLAPLSPAYAAGKMQLDALSILQGMKREGLIKSGLKDISNLQSNRNALLMGYSREEYDLLVQKLRESGIVQAVNVHSYAGDLPRKIETTRYSALGRAAEGALSIGTLRPLRRGLEKYGFELGEQYNVAASYMMALKLYRDGNKIKKLTDIGNAGWDEIRTHASNLSLAMHRANAAGYQYGLLSLPLQFLQFTQKVFLTYMRAIPGVDKLGNKAFTPAQARKLLLGQLVMFGGSAFGLRPEIESWLADKGFDGIPDTVKDMIAGGSIDWVLNELLQKATGDEDLRWAFGDILAPGGNMINLVREMVQTISEQPAIVAALGPSYVTASRFGEGIMMAKEIWSHNMFEESAPEDRALYAIEAVGGGLMSGYNDFLKARLAMKMGFWATQSGHQTEIEAKWSQAVVKAGLGVSPQALVDANSLKYDVSQELKNLDEVAQESYNRMYRVVGLFGDSSDRQRFLSDVRQEQALLQVLEPHELQYVWKKWQAIERDNAPRKPLSAVIAEAIGQGYQGSELRDRVASTHALDHDEATRAQLLDLLDRAQQDVDWTNKEIYDSTQKEIEFVKENAKSK